MVPIELHWPLQRRAVVAQGVITDLGDLTVCSGRTSAVKVERTRALARDALEPCIFVNVQRTGSSMVIQGDKEAVLHPDGLVIYDSHRAVHAAERRRHDGRVLSDPTLSAGAAAQHDSRCVRGIPEPGPPPDLPDKRLSSPAGR